MNDDWMKNFSFANQLVNVLWENVTKEYLPNYCNVNWNS